MKLLIQIGAVLCLFLFTTSFDLIYKSDSFKVENTPLAKENDTSFRKYKGSGPRHWIAYEYCWTNNKPIPEEIWKKNIDWVNENFKSYGYDMISNDGWIENAQTINKNGYITKYNDDWKNGFAYWSNYLKKRDLKMGIYYNPMWLTKAAYNNNAMVKGTTKGAREIAGATSFNSELYWVDVAKPGAKEWIQGYVNYFIDLGATYLRIDFLENYERNYGTSKYAQALEWIKEAANGRIIISLVMPNCFNHAQTELLYGDMIRIDDDCFNGGWDFVSDRKRGTWQSHWPQYGNAFDGFINFADIGGRGQMILDGDFIRLNTLSNDVERKFQFSLFVLTGSPLTIADQFNTIGNSAWIYQNKELLELNDLGFVAKPISYDTRDGYNSSRWVGQLPDGSWVVGLFNREKYEQSSHIDFVEELGFSSEDSMEVRDLWLLKDLGKLSGKYTTKLAPHECKVLRIKKTVIPKYEAEVASMIGGVRKNTSHANFSGIGFVDNIKNIGSKVLFAVQVPINGEYTLKAGYANATGVERTTSVYVNDVKINGQLEMPNLANWNTWGIASKKVALHAGVNYITIQYDTGDNGNFRLDYIQLLP